MNSYRKKRKFSSYILAGRRNNIRQQSDQVTSTDYDIAASLSTVFKQRKTKQ